MNNNTLSTLSNAKVELGNNFLSLNSPMTDGELSEVFGALSKMQGSTLFWIGDFLNAVENKKGEAYAKVYAETDYHPGTLWNAKSVCKRLPKSSRVGLSFAHHKEALVETKGDAALAVKYLREAEHSKLTVKQMRQNIRLAVADNLPDAVKDATVTYDKEFVAVMDSLGFVRRFLETANSTTFALKKGYVLAEIEEIYDLAKKVCI